MSQSPLSDDRQRDQANRAVMAALNDLQRSSSLYGPPSEPEADNLAGSGRIHPLLALLIVVIAFILALITAIPLLLIVVSASGIAEPGMTSEQLSEKILGVPMVVIASTFLQSLIFIGVVAIHVRLMRKYSWRWLGIFRGMFTMRTVGWGMAGGVLFLVMSAAVSVIGQTLGSAESDQARLFQIANGSQIERSLMLLAVGLIGPVAEEIIFRGYLQRAFIDKLGPWPGILLTSAIFAVPHLAGINQGQAILLLSVFLGGVLMGWLYWRTRSLGTSILAHVVNNSVAMLALLFTTQVQP